MRSRVERYKVRNLAAGLCRQCPKPRATKRDGALATLCDDCLIKANERTLARYHRLRGHVA